MGALERAVRESLTRASALSPAPPPDPAGGAIRRGQRIRRRQSVTGLVAVVAMTMLAVSAVAAVREGATGNWGLGPGPTGHALPSASPARLVVPPVDVVVGDMLRTADGDRIDLSGAGEVTGAVRAAGGFLVVAGGAASQTVWFAHASDAPQRLVEAEAAVVDAAGGGRVAWRDGDRLATAAVTEGRLGEKAESVAPLAVVPVGFAGSGVRLARISSGARVGQDLWFPSSGPYVPTWENPVLAVYGALPDGRTLVGQVAGPGGERCLALLDVTAGLRATSTACGLGLTSDALGWVSPAGRWLVAEVSAGSGAEAALIDLTAVFGADPRTVRVGAPPHGGAAWENSDTVVRAVGGALQRLRLDRLWSGLSGGTEELALADVPPGVTLLVVNRQPL